MPKKTEPVTVKSVLRTLLVQRAHIDEAGVISWWEYKRMGYQAMGHQLPAGMLQNLKTNGYVDLDKHGFYRINQKGVDTYYGEKD